MIKSNASKIISQPAEEQAGQAYQRMLSEALPRVRSTGVCWMQMEAPLTKIFLKSWHMIDLHLPTLAKRLFMLASPSPIARTCAAHMHTHTPVSPPPPNPSDGEGVQASMNYNEKNCDQTHTDKMMRTPQTRILAGRMG